jgi:hypothetical protein
MNGGKISGNTSSSGSGVNMTDGTFTMNNGTISCITPSLEKRRICAYARTPAFSYTNLPEGVLR